MIGPTTWCTCCQHSSPTLYATNCTFRCNQSFPPKNTATEALSVAAAVANAFRKLLVCWPDPDHSNTSSFTGRRDAGEAIKCTIRRSYPNVGGESFSTTAARFVCGTNKPLWGPTFTGGQRDWFGTAILNSGSCCTLGPHQLR
jgi:hypothetical protein